LCTTNDVITISWQALNEFSGFNVLIRGDGKENVIRRCCRGNLLGSCCCPIGNNSAELNIDFKGNYSYGITKVVARLFSFISAYLLTLTYI